MCLNLTDITYSGNDKHEGNTRKWAEKHVKLNTDIKTVLEEANVNGGLDDFVFVKARFRLVTNSAGLYKSVSSTVNEKVWCRVTDLV